MMTPYDIHIGEWVYGHHLEGSDNAPNGTDVYYPVCIDKIDNDSIQTIDGEIYDFEHLSPIPFNQKTVKLFDWSNSMKTISDVISLHRNWQTEEMFFRYTVGNRRMREKYGLTSINEVQQWYYDTFKIPLRLTLSEKSSYFYE